MIFRKQKLNYNLSETTVNALSCVLTDIRLKLGEAGYYEQPEFVNNLLVLLMNKKQQEFVNSLNSIEMWGGSGAVWESTYNLNAEEQEALRDNLLELLEIMEKNGLLGQRAKSIYKTLK